MILRVRRLLGAIVVSALVMLTCCAKPEPIVVYGVTLSESSVVFDAHGGEKCVTVTPFPEGEEWVLNGSSAEWLSFEVVPEGVVITANENTSTQTRSTLFTILSPTNLFDPFQVSVHQEAAPEVTFSTSAAESYTFDSEGGSLSFVVLTEAEWSVEVDGEWLEVEIDESLVTLSAQPNDYEVQLSALLTLSVGSGEQLYTQEIAVLQQTRAENKYLNLLGEWEITASKWFYSPNGSLNSLDYNPSPEEYYLIFDMEQGEYGKTLIMKDFLYPGTELEVRYDAATGSIVIPFGWTVLSYDVFLYLTLVSDRQFSYAAGDVVATPSEEGTGLTLELPTVSGFNYVGFGLWTYNDNGAKIALGSQYRPTMFPMGPIVFRKKIL